MVIMNKLEHKCKDDPADSSVSSLLYVLYLLGTDLVCIRSLVGGLVRYRELLVQMVQGPAGGPGGRQEASRSPRGVQEAC